jgi:glycosyltransferase involved in cell wall biosynthesis
LTLHFYEPPPAQKAGGLDIAIRSLQRFLQGNGVTIRTNASPREFDVKLPGQAVHFHGLWQPQFLNVSRRCRASGIPYVVSPHGMLEPWAWRQKLWKKLPYYCFFERAQLKNARAVLATSRQEAGNLRRFAPSHKIKALPLGLTDSRGPAYLAAREKLGWKSDESVFLYLSRIHPKKGLHLLLRALCSMADSLPAKWRLVVVGDGEEKFVAECRNCSRAHSEVFRLTEWKGAMWGDDKWIYCQGADLFCLPSFSENFGLALLEACQVGTPILTTRQTPWDFLVDGRSAFFVEPEVESIQKGLSAFLTREAWTLAERDALSHDIHDRFDWSKVGPQYLELYESIIGRD